MNKSHLSSRDHKPFNEISKGQEKDICGALNDVYTSTLHKYKHLEIKTIRKFDIDQILAYLNRPRKMRKQPLITKKDIEAEHTRAKGLMPDGKIWLVKSKKSDDWLIFCVVEIKHQGSYKGYTPMTKSDAERKGKKSPYPPQAQGNAIERFAKNLNAFRTLNKAYNFNPYVIFCDGFDFYMKEEYPIFKKMPHAKNYKNTDSSIRMRLISGNEFKKLNEIYVVCDKEGSCPATIMAKMEKWKREEVVTIMEEIIATSLKHLASIGEI